MSPEELFKFYNNIFVPIYSEVVARRRKKPRQVAIEIENAFAHLSTYYLSESDDEKNINLLKALGHLHRATLDCQKILWVTLSDDASYLEKRGLIEHASNVSIEEVYKQYKIAKEMSYNTRISESQNTGINILERIEQYQKSIDAFKKFDDMIDIVKVKMYEEKERKNTLKSFALNQSSGLIVGVIAGLVVGAIL